VARPFRLQAVLDVADQRLEAATTELHQLRARLEQEQNRYDQLQAFNAEYSAGLQEALRTGMQAHRLRDYRQFLDKLTRAVAVQAEEVERCRRAWDESFQRWLELRQRHQALGVLKQRYLAGEARREAQIEQKQQDEFARRDRRRE
jgi:flagellar FliJ protein